MKTIPFTRKFPYMYIIELSDYTYSTTDQRAAEKLESEFKERNITCAHNMPFDLQMKIARSSFTISRTPQY